MQKNEANSKKIHLKNKTNINETHQDISLRLGTSFKESTINQKTQTVQSDKVYSLPNSDQQFILKPLNPQKQKNVYFKDQIKVQIPKEYLPVYLENCKDCPGKQFFGNKFDAKGSQETAHHKSLWQKQVQKNKLWEIQINDQKKYRKGKGDKQYLRSSKVVPNEIFQPFPAKKTCQICRYNYEDYLQHLQEANHKRVLKQTVGNYYIQKEANQLQKSKKQLIQSQDFVDIIAMRNIFSQAKHKMKKSLQCYLKQVEEIQTTIRNQYNQN